MGLEENQKDEQPFMIIPDQMIFHNNLSKIFLLLSPIALRKMLVILP